MKIYFYEGCVSSISPNCQSLVNAVGVRAWGGIPAPFFSGFYSQELGSPHSQPVVFNLDLSFYHTRPFRMLRLEQASPK